jgi:hypothetical protein
MCILVSISMFFVLIPRACRSRVGHMLALYKPQNMGNQNLNFFPLIVKHIFKVFRSFFMKKYLFRNNYVSKTNFWKVKLTSCQATCSLLSLATKLEKNVVLWMLLKLLLSKFLDYIRWPVYRDLYLTVRVPVDIPFPLWHTMAYFWTVPKLSVG